MRQRVLLIITILIAALTPIVEVSAQTQQVNTTQSHYNLPIDPIVCNKLDPTLSCPVELEGQYRTLEETCATSYADFLTDPIKKHYWIEDPEITAQGKADERARQFLYWVLNTNPVDEAPVLRSIWNVSSIIALFGIVLIAGVFGIGYILSTRTNYNFDFKIRIWPTVIKIGTMLLYVAFSSAIVFILIQFSEVSMRFFYENLGGRDLFNIYFAAPATGEESLLGGTEESYKSFVGCRDLNIRVQEGIDTEIFMLKATNVSYYVMGSMLLIRKILLWFLLFVSPFLALLMPFILIRNTGWIWIGVFFQWLFYGPLVALFLGATSQIWGQGIPFSFDFSRVGTDSGYVYPTGINIVYGGPAQRLENVVGGFNRPIGALNNANYVDTFAEYVITLLMLWAVTFFPWWLLRIFRDYCCEGIYAMKNILLALYDHLRGGPPSGPSPSRPPGLSSLKLDTKTPVQTDIRVSLGSMEQIRKTMTQDIAKNMNIQATKITDIARVQTNKQMNSIVNQNLTYLANPVKASVPAQRQQYMNLRSELFARAIKNDTVARTILASTSTSTVEKARIRESLIRSMPQTSSLSQVIMTEIHVPKETVTLITNNYTKNLTNNSTAIASLAESTKTTAPVVTNILNSYNKHTSQPIGKIVQEIAKEQKTSEKIVREVLKESGVMSSPSHIVDHVATVQKLTRDQVSKVIHGIRSSVTRESSTLEEITTSTKLPPPLIQKTVQSLVTAVTHDKELRQQLTTGLPPDLPQITVKAVLDALTVNLSQPTSRLVEKVAFDTKTNQTVVSQLLNNTVKTINTSSLITQTAEQVGVPPAQIKTLIDTLTQHIGMTRARGPAIESLSTHVQPSAPLGPERIATVIQELFQNKEIITQVSQQTNTTETQVQQVLSSYAKHVDQSSSELVQSISQETYMNQSQVQSILQSVSSVSSSPQILNQIAQTTHINEQTIKHIAAALPATVKATDTSKPVIAQIISSAPPAQPTVTQEQIQTFFNSVATHDVLVKQVSSETHVSENQVQQVLNQYAENTTHTNQEAINHISQSTSIPTSTVQQILTTTSSTISNSPQLQTTLANTTDIDQSHVKHIAEALPATVGMTTSTETIAQTLTQSSSRAVQTTSQQTQNLFQSAAQNTSLITQVSTVSQATENQVTEVLQAYAGNTTNNATETINQISQATAIPTNTVQRILSHTSSAIVHSSQLQTELAETTHMEKSEVQQIAQSTAPLVSVIASYVTTEQLPTETIQSVLTTFNSTEIASTVAKQTGIEQTQVQSILTSYTNNLSQPSQEITQRIAQQTNATVPDVEHVIQTLSTVVSSSPNIQQMVAETTKIQTQTVNQIATTLPQTLTTEITSAPQPITRESIHSLFQTLSNNNTWVNQIAGATQTDAHTVQSVLTTFDQSLDQNMSTILNTVAQETNTSVEQVRNVIQHSSQTILDSKEIQNHLSQESHTSAETVNQIAHSLQQTIQTGATDQPVTAQISAQFADAQAPTRQSIATLVQTIATHPTVITAVAEKTHIAQTTVQSALQTFTTNLSQSSADLVQTIAESSHITEEQVQTILGTTSEVVRQSPELVSQIAQSTDNSTTTVEQLATALPQTIEAAPAAEKEPLVKVISYQTNISEQDSQQIIHNLITTAIEDTAFITHLAETTQLKSQQVKNVLTTYANRINQPTDRIISTINQASGIPKENVQMILITLTDSILSSDQIVSKVAEETGVNANEVSTVLQKQMEFATEPEKHIEKTIAIPQSISLEDYEEVKDMWAKHYEEGEVPVSETIKTRADWIEQEIVYITNTLNKILSPDEKLQQEGLDELGYLLPIFLINNLKGEELIVYLKAKLEAAKLVLKILGREEAVKEELKQDEDDEVLVDLPKKKEEEQPHALHMTIDDEEETSPEDRVKAVQEKLQAVDNPPNQTGGTIRTLSDIQSRLQEEAEK